MFLKCDAKVVLFFCSPKIFGKKIWIFVEISALRPANVAFFSNFADMKHLFVVAVSLVLWCGSFGQTLTDGVVLDFASKFFSDSYGGAGGYRSRSFVISGNGVQTVSASDLDIVCRSSNSMVVALVDGSGFVAICGTDENMKVAGYGYSADSSVPVQLSGMLAGNGAVFGYADMYAEWAAEDGFKLPVAPIVKSVRHQSAPFNNLCPYYIYDDGAVSLERCLVGCVATAAEQIVSHYAYPDKLLDSIAGFSSANNGELPSIPAGTRIDFDNILDEYTEGGYAAEQAQAVAELSYYLGVACKMNWGVGSSGAKISRLVEPLHRAFGYRYVRCVNSYDYSPRRWFDLLMMELSAGRPILYAGYATSGGGHAFVVDGINTDGYLHITWGYGGLYDGYFDLGALTPQENPLEPTVEGSVLGVGHLQQALFISPDSVEYVVDDTLSMEHRIEIDSVWFNRSPDTNRYVTASIKLRNISDTDVYSPVELLTYSETDSLGIPTDADYLGLADAIVKAHSDTTLMAYLQFTATGSRLLAVNTVDSLYLSFAAVDVKKASQPQLAFEVMDCSTSDKSVCFDISVSNLSKYYWSGRTLTYSLFEGDYTEEEGDWRHFRVINLPPGGEMRDTVSFGNLKPDTQYTFVIRNPWNPALQYPFATDDVTAVGSLEAERRRYKANHPTYRLNQRIVLEYDESTGNYRQILRRQQ